MSAHWQGGNGGKGSSPRPKSVSNEEYANRWDAIFGRDVKEESDKDDCEDTGKTQCPSEK